MGTIIWKHLDEERGAFYVTIFTDWESALCSGSRMCAGNHKQACDREPLQKINKRNRKHGADEEPESEGAEAEDGKYVPSEPWTPQSGCVHRKPGLRIPFYEDLSG